MNESVTEAPKGVSTRGQGKAWSIFIVTVVIVGLIFHFIKQRPVASSNGKESLYQTKTIVLTASDWVVVPTHGRDWNATIQPVRGVKPKYLVCINDLESVPIKIPGPDTYWLGNKKKIQKVFLRLDYTPDLDEADLEFKLEKE